MNNNLINHIFL